MIAPLRTGSPARHPCRWLPLLAAALFVAGCDVFSPDSPSGHAPTATMTTSISAPVSPGARLEVGFHATDVDGMGVAGAEVTFEVIEGGGRVENNSFRVDTTTKVTDQDGRAVTYWRLGDEVGTHTLSAQAVLPPENEGGEPIEFEASVTAEALGESDPFEEVSAGGNHTCALTGGGQAYCWGANAYGQLGLGAASVPPRSGSSVPTQDRPVRLHEAPTFASIFLGHSHACAIDTAGESWCWGWNHEGQLGTGGREDVPAPAPLDSDVAFVSFALGQEHSCGLAADGTAYCWGSGAEGQLGTGSEEDELRPVPVAGDLEFTALSASTFRTCGLAASGTVYCWGLHPVPITGPGVEEEAVLTPRAVQGDVSFSTVGVGTRHACGLTDAGAAYCWGPGPGLGTGPSHEDNDEPAPVQGGLTFRSLATGSGATCGVTTDGETYCWGSGQYGQLGDEAGGPGSRRDHPHPIVVDPEVSFTSVHSFFPHTCAIADQPEPAVYCWGLSGSGQTGRGPGINPQPVPAPVLMPGPPE